MSLIGPLEVNPKLRVVDIHIALVQEDLDPEDGLSQGEPVGGALRLADNTKNNYIMLFRTGIIGESGSTLDCLQEVPGSPPGGDPALHTF